MALQVRGGDRRDDAAGQRRRGIKEPDFSQSFGVSFFAQGNPDLKPERSRTFDVGVEQRLGGGRGRVEATYFDHRYDDQIAYQIVDFDTFQGTLREPGRDQGARPRDRARGRARLVSSASRRSTHISTARS